VAGPVRGAGLAVAHGGELVLERYAGEAAPGLLAGPCTLWPLASISKLYTAAAAMALIERGDLTLSTRVASVLPSFTQDGRDRVTLRHLLTHTAGLIYESPRMPELLAKRTPLDAIVNEAYDGELSFRPGASQLYSDLGIAVAGRMIATVAGMPFPDAVRRLVLEPAGLTDTFMPPPRSEDGRIAYVDGVFAEGTDGAMYNSAYARDLAHPAFGTVATLRDLLAFGLCFAPDGSSGGSRRLFSRSGTTAMVTDQTGADLPGEIVEPVTGVVHPWGLGFMIKGRGVTPELASPESYGHGGATGCNLWIDPRHELVVAFVSNRHYNADPDELFFRLERVVNVVLAEATRD
jgi:CubicO group peptidase (beta-lactamase class C family)